MRKARLSFLICASLLLPVVPGKQVGAQVKAPGARRQASGVLHLDVQGDRKICARMHEPELVKILYPDSYPMRQFTTFGYRLQMFAHHQEHETLRFLLVDSGKIETVGRIPLTKPRTGRNPLPGPLAQKGNKDYREYWIGDATCYELPEFEDISLPEGEYELQLLYYVRGPNGTWFRLIESTLAEIPILPSMVTPVIALLEDDGRNRVIELSIDADPEPVEVEAADPARDLEEKKAARRSLELLFEGDSDKD